MRDFVQMANAVGGTSKKLEKLRLVTEFLKSLGAADRAIAARFLSGRAFAAHDERTLGVGGTNLFRVIAEAAGQPSHNLGTAYRKHGDLGDMAEELLRTTNARGDLALEDVARLFEDLATARGPSQKAELLAVAFRRASAGDVKYIVKIITGDLRIGSKESLVEEAIAKAFEQPLAEVRRANMLTGDIGETLTLAAENNLARATVRLFHPMDSCSRPRSKPPKIFSRKNWPRWQHQRCSWKKSTTESERRFTRIAAARWASFRERSTKSLSFRNS